MKYYGNSIISIFSPKSVNTILININFLKTRIHSLECSFCPIAAGWTGKKTVHWCHTEST